MSMHVLVTGAGGFIGSHLVVALLSQGFRVTAAARDCGEVQRRFPGIRCLSCDFSRDHHPDDWLPRLSGVDAVINAVGIISEDRRQRFDDLHTRAPAALFDACRQAGVGKVVQISALGADAEAVSRYHLSKRAADRHLARSDLEWVVLRPSIRPPGQESTAAGGRRTAGDPADPRGEPGAGGAPLPGPRGTRPGTHRHGGPGADAVPRPAATAAALVGRRPHPGCWPPWYCI